MPSLVRSLPLCLIVAAGCQTRPSFQGDTVIPPSAGMGELQQALATQGDGPNGAHIIFVNFDGQAIQPAPNYIEDPSTGASMIAQQSANVAAFDTSPYSGQFTADQAKAAIMNYVKQFYAPFNAQVVSTRPAPGTRYTMCVVGDYASTVLGGQAGSAAGVAPLDCDNQQENNIVYAFAASLAPSGQNGLGATDALKAIAVTVAQETAHAYGLSHTDNNVDIMYPVLDPNQNEFVDATSNGYMNPNGMCHGATSQNSKQMLQDTIGQSNGQTVTNLPTVSFVAPKQGDTVPYSFTIIVDAAEMNGSISKVTVSSGSAVLSTMTQPPFRFTKTEPSGSDGTYTLTATAYDGMNNFQSSSVTFKVSASAPAQQLPPCMGDSDCQSGFTCQSGQCVQQQQTTGSTGSTGSTGGTTGGTSGGTSSTTGGTSGGSTGGILTGIPTGGDCTTNDECMSGVCDTRGGHDYCTQTCDPTNATSCPAGLTCVADSGTHLCQRPSADSGGCSAVGSTPVGSAFGLFCYLGLLAFATRPRRLPARRRRA